MNPSMRTALLGGFGERDAQATPAPLAVGFFVGPPGLLQ